MSGYPGAPPPEKSGFPGAPPAENPNSGNLYPSVPPPAYPPAYQPYDQPPQGPPQAMPPPVVQTVVMQAPYWGHDPVRTVCSHCQSEVTSGITSEPGVVAWIAAGVICFVGGFCGCCLIPFCIDSMKQTTHKCPNCNHIMGKSKSGI